MTIYAKLVGFQQKLYITNTTKKFIVFFFLDNVFAKNLYAISKKPLKSVAKTRNHVWKKQIEQEKK